MTYWRAWILLLFASLNSCKSTDSLPNPILGSSNQPYNPPSSDQNSAPIETRTDENYSYPTLEFTGKGVLSHRNGDANIVQKLKADLSSTQVRLVIEIFKAISGDNYKEVNEKIANDIGIITYDRVQKEELAQLEQSQQFNNASYLIFSKSLHARDGSTYTLSAPIPVLVVPADAARYDSLSSGAISYRASVTVSGGTPFNIEARVSRVSTSSVSVQIDYVIAEDQKGKIYGSFPAAKTTVYNVDPNAKQIQSMKTQSVYYDKDDNKQHAINIEYSLCRSTQNGNSQNIGSGCTL